MPDSVDKRIAKLIRLSRTELCDLCEKYCDTFPATQVRRDLVIPILAYRIQEEAFGSLKAGTRTRLRQLAEGFANNTQPAPSSKPTLKPGTRLVREWRDQVHLVNVETNDYEYKGGRYKSLSQIARLITGTRWSGPAFFGINGQRSNNNHKEVR